MKKELRSICIFSIVFLLFDQFIKIFLNSIMNIGQSIPLIKNFLSITLVYNNGAAFSILSGSRWLLVSIGVLALFGIVIYLNKQDSISKLNIIIYSLLIGGVFGNLLDRVVNGYVIDYISFNFNGYYFPVFNLADTFIVISAVLIVLGTFRESLWKK